MFGINGWEVVLLALIAVFVLGPERLPEYAAKLAQGIKKFRVMAEGEDVGQVERVVTRICDAVRAAAA